MTAPEVTHAVRDYLAFTGGSEVSQIRLGLGCRATLAEIRGALKRLGATSVKSVNTWPTLRTNPRVDASPFTLQKFTVYRLAD
jgi:hypothetical protein